MKESTKEQVAEEHGGFKSSRFTDRLFVLNQLPKKYSKKKKEIYVAFMDLKKSYDKKCREELGGGVTERM